MFYPMNSVHKGPSEFYQKLQNLTFKCFYSFKPSKVFSAIFGHKEIKLLSGFSRKYKDTLVISPPDKGRGVVLVDKQIYKNSILRILEDTSKFSVISSPILAYCLKIEDKINRFLSKLLKSNLITQSIYNSLHVTGSAPGILYGLPKIHKSDFKEKFQYRPILAAYNLASYKIAKYLVPILTPLTSNQYTVENSTEFAQKISSIPHADSLHMVSLDVESLFTNVPLEETIKIASDSLFSNATQTKKFVIILGILV